MTNDEYKAKCQWLSEFYAEAAKTGREIQTDYYDNENSTVWKKHPLGPNLQSTENHWRLKPEPQKAWVVWCPSLLVPIISVDEELAKREAAKYGATIQEITKPD